MAYSSDYANYIGPATPSNDYPAAFNFKLIDNVEELKRVLSEPTRFIGFDTETTD